MAEIAWMFIIVVLPVAVAIGFVIDFLDRLYAARKDKNSTGDDENG